jgi:hypothetical protein
VALTIRAKKMAGAIRGAERDHAERIIAERRHVERIMLLGERDTGKEICDVQGASAANAASHQARLLLSRPSAGLAAAASLKIAHTIRRLQ